MDHEKLTSYSAERNENSRWNVKSVRALHGIDVSRTIVESCGSPEGGGNFYFTFCSVSSVSNFWRKKKAAKSTYGCVKTDGNSKVFPLRLESRSQLCTQSVYGSWTFESPLGRASLPSRRFILSKWDVFDVFKLGSASRRTFFSGSLTYCVTSRHGNLLLNLFASCKKAFRVNQPIALWILSPVITDGDEGKICFSSILTWAFRHLVPPLFRTLNV